jgi:hypothetical protein
MEKCTMNDEIVGTAILTSDRNPADGYEYLFVVCFSPSRKTVQSAAIPIRAEGQPNPGNRGWTYKERGDLLDCCPSLKMSVPVDFDKPNGEMKETFHNSGAWTVKFVRKPLDEASDALHEINKDLINQLRATDL